MTTLEELILQRDTVLLSLDAGKIKVFMRSWGIPIPEDNREFWGIVCKALDEINAPERTKQSARIRMQYAAKK